LTGTSWFESGAAFSDPALFKTEILKEPLLAQKNPASPALPKVTRQVRTLRFEAGDMLRGKESCPEKAEMPDGLVSENKTKQPLGGGGGGGGYKIK
jgi:hypothetical protein